MIKDKNAIEYWNKVHQAYEQDELIMDDWLEKFNEIIDKTNLPIIDLGCGRGNDTLYLLKRNKEVISCDFSINAIKNIKNNFQNVKQVICFDMRDGLPFENNSSDIIIADLSLHYFLKEETENIIKELRRVLNANGYIFFRVNSINDINYGAGQGKQIEKHLYETSDGRLKRFFDEKDIKEFFKEFEIEYLKEEKMLRYDLEKRVLTGCVKNRKEKLK